MLSHFYPEGYIAPKGYYHREVVVAGVAVAGVAVAGVAGGDVVAIYVSADNSKTNDCIVFKFDTPILGLEAVS